MHTATADHTLPLMGHLVIGYPTLEQSLNTARAYARAGFRYLELQLPFSHPTADGATITQANRVAIDNGTTPEQYFAVLQTLRTEFPATEIVPMTYANKVFHLGMEGFAQRLRSLGITKAILPDLPFDSAEAEQLAELGVYPVPVLAANVPTNRLAAALHRDPPMVYLMAGYKLTGSAFGLDTRLTDLVQAIRRLCPETQVGIGFGISTRAEVEQVIQIADFAIIGSALLRAADENRLPEMLAELAS